MAVPALIGATALNIGSSMLGAKSQREQLEQQAQQLTYDAAAVAKDGYYQERKIREMTPKAVGATKSAAVGSGVEISGSVLDAIEETAFNIEMDALTTRENATQQANVKFQQAADLRNSKPSGLSTLLGVGGQALSGYAQYKMFQG